jgi:flagellar biosynthesis/type III secretory pathway chaperone
VIDSPAITNEIRAEWQLLIETTRQARQLNEANGLIIADGMRANQQALSVLLSAGSAGTYGPGGRTLNPLSSRTLGSA